MFPHSKTLFMLVLLKNDKNFKSPTLIWKNHSVNDDYTKPASILTKISLKILEYTPLYYI